MMIIIIFFTSYGGCVLCVTWKEKKGEDSSVLA